MKMLGLLMAAFCAAVSLQAAEMVFADGKAGANVVLPKDAKIENGALVWTHNKGRALFFKFTKPMDVTKCAALKIVLDSSAAFKAAVVLPSQPKKPNGFTYYFSRVAFRAGEQTVTLPLDKLMKVRDTVGFQQIDNVTINLEGWELTNPVGQVLKVKSVEFVD